MTLKSDAKFEEKLICCFKNNKHLVNFDLSTLNSQNFHFDWLLLCKLFNVWPKTFHDTEEGFKISRKTNLRFGKWHEEHGKFSSDHLKVSKLGLWWDPFIQSRKCMSLKFREDLWLMTMKNDEKFDKELSCRFKFEMRNLINFWSKYSKVSKMCTLMGSSWTKYIMFKLKKYKGVTFHGNEEWCKILRKTYLWFGKWYKEFANFYQCSRKSQNWDLHGIFLSKVENVGA